MMAKAYYTSYKLPIIITRGNNVYGPNQFPEKMIPKFTLLASRGEDLPVHGDGECIVAGCAFASQTDFVLALVCVDTCTSYIFNLSLYQKHLSTC